MKKTHLTISSPQTKEIGKILAKTILKSKIKKRAQVLGLEGDLGGGKTTFLQGFAKGLGIKEKILSPTFIIFKKFKVQNPKFKFFYHFDCYRIEKPNEILNLDFQKIISDPQNIIAIEWAEKIRKILPKNITWIKFKFITKRSFDISNHRFVINEKKRKITIHQ